MNHETGHVCVLAITDEQQLIEIDVPLDLAIEIAEAIDRGRKELEN